MSPDPATTGWDLVAVVAEGSALDVLGLNPWAHKWVPDGTRIRVAHPSYPAQRHLLSVYRLECGNDVIPFAAGELSASVSAFFIPWQEFR